MAHGDEVKTIAKTYPNGFNLINRYDGFNSCDPINDWWLENSNGEVVGFVSEIYNGTQRVNFYDQYELVKVVNPIKDLFKDEKYFHGHHQLKVLARLCILRKEIESEMNAEYDYLYHLLTTDV